MRLELFSDTHDFPFFIQMGGHDQDLYAHKHADYTELVIVTKGGALHRVDDDSWPIARGDVFAVSGDSVHEYRETDKLRVCNIMFRMSVLGNLARTLRTLHGFQALFVVEPALSPACHFKSRLRLSPGKMEEVEALLDRLVREYDRREPGWTALVTALFLELVVKLSRWYDALPPPAEDSPFRVAKGAAWLESHYDRAITVEDIATHACLSPRHFSRLFAQSHGLSPHQYLLKLRLSRACELLADTDQAVSEVSARCGFDDSSHFSRQFKRALGMSPSEYRAERR